MLHVGKLRISLRGKCIEYVFADPRTQRELFPGQQKYLQAHQVQGDRSASSLLDLWIWSGAGSVLFAAGARGCPGRADPGSQTSLLHLSRRWDGEAGGWAEGGVAGTQPGEGYYRLGQLL